MFENRREFLERLSVVSAGLLGAQTLRLTGTAGAPTAESWDMSWVERLKSARYKAVIDASVLEDGYAPSLASGLFGDFRDAEGATEDQVRVVIVSRRLGTPLVFNDALWERFPIGEDTKTTDSSGAPVKRNPYYRPRPGAPPESANDKLETLQKRGVILLVCNIALNNWSRGMAQKMNRTQADLVAEVKANLVPGTIVMPSGVFALMRAQNAGCAYMRGQ